MCAFAMVEQSRSYANLKSRHVRQAGCFGPGHYLPNCVLLSGECLVDVCLNCRDIARSYDGRPAEDGSDLFDGDLACLCELQ